MFCQDDIKITRETHYGSLYIDASDHKHLGSKFNKSQIDRSSGIGLDTNVLSTGTIQMQCIEAWNSVGDDKEQLCCN